MKNPYEVLGISSSATDDDVKKAYREAAAKFSGDPAKMDEINSAYDHIILSRNSGCADNRNDAYNSGNYSGASGGLGDIRAKLNAGRIDDAEMLLDGIPLQRRTAEWYFLKGTIQQRRGWLESAAESFRKAAEDEPNNKEYRNAYENINRSRKGDFRNSRDYDDNDGCCGSPCHLCMSLLCADSCCECMGGDLIRCC